MRWIFAVMVLLLLMYAELLLGNLSLVVPLTGCGIFYFAVNGSRKMALILALVSGGVLEMGFGRIPGVMSGIFLLTVFFGWYWVRIQPLRPLLFNCIPGGLTGGLTGSLPLLLFHCRWCGGSGVDGYVLASAVLTVIFSALFFPFCIFVLDRWGAAVDLPRYLDQERNSRTGGRTFR